MAIFPPSYPSPPQNTKYSDYLSSLLRMGVPRQTSFFLFRNVRNFDVWIQYTKRIQSEDKIGGKNFLIQSV